MRHCSGTDWEGPVKDFLKGGVKERGDKYPCSCENSLLPTHPIDVLHILKRKTHIHSRQFGALLGQLSDKHTNFGFLEFGNLH